MMGKLFGCVIIFSNFFAGYCGSEIPYSIFLDSYSIRVAVRPFWASLTLPLVVACIIFASHRPPLPSGGCSQWTTTKVRGTRLLTYYILGAGERAFHDNNVLSVPSSLFLYLLSFVLKHPNLIPYFNFQFHRLHKYIMSVTYGSCPNGGTW
jgi:hypothetical protein